ncbi:hypothetical protein CDAR_243061 [Caerostris darwini]|uniref:Reverse transcriptase domain-containing protein n=1 Tax=Caerostris darwini TaxID=1538125 RepID=A0AAV4SSK8_9ARAC|nr:hypothetical protein CDAR_243061 [Caerostris darwini]
MSRLPFGVANSPFILFPTIKHHIQSLKDEYWETVKTLDNSLYVDDLFYGAYSTDEAFFLSSTTVKILKYDGLGFFAAGIMEIRPELPLDMSEKFSNGVLKLKYY